MRPSACIVALALWLVLAPAWAGGNLVRNADFEHAFLVGGPAE